MKGPAFELSSEYVAFPTFMQLNDFLRNYNLNGKGNPIFRIGGFFYEIVVEQTTFHDEIEVVEYNSLEHAKEGYVDDVLFDWDSSV